MRTYEESMEIIGAALGRFPGLRSGSAQLQVECSPHGSWWVIVRLWLPMSDNDSRRQKITIESRSCELDKAIDSLATKIVNTLALTSV